MIGKSEELGSLHGPESACSGYYFEGLQFRLAHNERNQNSPGHECSALIPAASFPRSCGAGWWETPGADRWPEYGSRLLRSVVEFRFAFSIGAG